MKRLFNSIQYISVVLLALAISACTEPEIYEKTGIPEGGQVYFTNVPSNIDLSDGSGKFSIPIYRSDASSDFTVDITSDAADTVFTVPASVSFTAGRDVSVIEVTYDPTKVEVDVPYEISISVTDNGTPFGMSSCSFVAMSASPWQVLCTATFTEEFWEETHHVTIYYRDEGNLRYCLVKGEEPCDNLCVPGEGSPEKGVWGTGFDFNFIWHLGRKDANGYDILEVPKQYLFDYQGNAAAPVYYGDYYHYWTYIRTDQYDGTFDDYLADGLASSYPLSYYDGKGGFYFNLKYYVPAVGGGWTDYDYDVVAIDDAWKNKRTVDYNTAIEYAAAYEVTAESMMFSEDGTTPLEFDAQIRYDDDYDFDEEEFDPEKDEVITTTYYVRDYFAKGSGLAFIAPIPELLEDGAAIDKVANEQNTGVNIFGNTLFVKVEKGSVSFAEDSEFPTFTVSISAYTKKKDINKETGEVTYTEVVNDFGKFEEIFTAFDYASDRYTIEDLEGANKSDYFGLYSTSFMYMEAAAEVAQGEIRIQDAGSYQGTEYVAISGLSGWYGWKQNSSSPAFDDTIFAEWDPELGALVIIPQILEGKLTYQGVANEMAVGVVDPATGRYYDGGLPIFAGFTEEGSVAFVAHPQYSTYFGLYWYSTDESFGGLCFTYDIVATPSSGTSVLSVSNRGVASFKKEVTVNKDFTIGTIPAVLKSKEARKINTTNIKPVVKSNSKKNLTVDSFIPSM